MIEIMMESKLEAKKQVSIEFLRRKYFWAFKYKKFSFSGQIKKHKLTYVVKCHDPEMSTKKLSKTEVLRRINFMRNEKVT